MPALPPALDTPATPRTPLAAPPRPTRSRPCPVPPPIRAAPWLRSLALFGGGWQDLRTMHDSRGPCSEKCPFLAGSSRGVSSNGGLRGFSDTWRAYLAKASSFRMHGVRILPRTGDFPVRGPFRDAWSAKLATDCRPRTHRGEILPRQSARGRIAREYCHCQSGQGRIRAQSRHRRTPGNALREHIAIVERPETHQGTILPSPGARKRIRAQSCHRQAPGNTSMKNLHNRHLTIVYKSLTRNQAEYNKEIGF